MARPISKVAPEWWDYTTLDEEILNDAARLTPEDMRQLSRPGFNVVMYDTLEEFYLAEALEYVNAWRQSTPDNPAGICGPIGPTEQLPLVARLVNDLELDIRSAHFWGIMKLPTPTSKSMKSYSLVDQMSKSHAMRLSTAMILVSSATTTTNPSEDATA